MSSKTEICNLALSHLAVGTTIQNLDTDESTEGAVCRTYYDICRKTVQRDFAWPAFKQYAALALISENPNTEWEYAYRLPQNCAHTNRILSGQRVDNDQTAVPFEKGSDSEGILLFTDEEDAVLEYTKDVTDTKYFEPDFEMALSLYLAYFISPRITAGDANRLGQRAFSTYQVMIERAKVRALNEQQKSPDPLPEMVTVRL